MANSRTHAELKNCKLESPSPLFRPLAQYLGSDKQRVLSPCVTNQHFIPCRHSQEPPLSGSTTPRGCLFKSTTTHRCAPDYSIDTVSELTCQRAICNYE